MPITVPVISLGAAARIGLFALEAVCQSAGSITQESKQSNANSVLLFILPPEND
jgi:hypothetical protein